MAFLQVYFTEPPASSLGKKLYHGELQDDSRCWSKDSVHTELHPTRPLLSNACEVLWGRTDSDALANSVHQKGS